MRGKNRSEKARPIDSPNRHSERKQRVDEAHSVLTASRSMPTRPFQVLRPARRHYTAPTFIFMSEGCNATCDFGALRLLHDVAIIGLSPGILPRGWR